MAELQTQRLRPAYQGWNTEASPDYLGEAQAPVLQNMLCRTGKTVIRGPVSRTAVLDHTYVNQAGQTRPTYGALRGSLVKDNKAYLALSVEFSQLPERSATITLNSTAPTFTTAIASPIVGANTFPSGHSVQLGSFAYASSYGVGVVKWSGAGVPTFIAATNGVSIFADIIDHTERLFVAGGNYGLPSTAGSPATMLYTKLLPSTGLAGTLDDWQDPTSGLVNQIKVGEDSDPIVAFGRAGRDLVILKRSSVWIMSGSGPSTYSVRRVASTLGCVSAESVVSVDDGCYFASDRGYHYFDGANFQLVSRDIDPTMQAALANTTSYQYGGSRWTAHQIGFIRAGYLSGGGIMLTMGVETFDPTASPKVPNALNPVFQAVYDIKRQTWMAYRSDIHQDIGITACLPLGDKPMGFDGWCVFLLDELLNPEGTTIGIGGIDNRPAGLLTGSLPAYQPGINAKWWSRLVRLGSPVSAAQLHRILVDYRMIGVANIGGWYITVVGGDGTVVVPEYQLPGEDNGSFTHLARMRSSDQVFGEAIEVQVRAEWKNSTGPLWVAELYDVTIEYQATRQRGSS